MHTATPDDGGVKTYASLGGKTDDTLDDDDQQGINKPETLTPKLSLPTEISQVSQSRSVPELNVMETGNARVQMDHQIKIIEQGHSDGV